MASTHEPDQMLEPSNLLEPIDLTDKAPIDGMYAFGFAGSTRNFAKPTYPRDQRRTSPHGR